MGRRAGVAALALVVGISAAAPAGAAAACAQDGEVTIAKNKRVTVVAKPSGAYHVGVYACLDSSDRRVEVESDLGPEVERLKLSGVFVAYVVSEQLGEEYGRDYVVRDLREEDGPEPGTAPGHLVETGDVSEAFPQAPEGPFVRRFGLRPDGSTAYTVWHSGRWTVRAWAPGLRRPSVLDPGPGLDPAYLKLRGRTVRWRRRGAGRSAPLPAPRAAQKAG